MQTKAVAIKACGANGQDPGGQEAQANPDVNEQKSQTEQEKAQGRIARGGEGAQPTQLAIAAFNTEATAVALIDLLGRPIQGNDDESQPFEPPFASLIGNAAGIQDQVGTGAIGEGIRGAVGFASVTQGARTALAHLPTQGTGDDRREVLVLQQANHLARAEAFIHVQHAWS